ncbi:MAG: hypothetical protein ACOCYN_04055, partial [Planctomycetota bacterium]
GLFRPGGGAVVSPVAPHPAPVFEPQPGGASAIGPGELDLEGGGVSAGRAMPDGERTHAADAPAATAGVAEQASIAAEGEAVVAAEHEAVVEDAAPAAADAPPAEEGPDTAGAQEATAVDEDLAAAIHALSGAPAPSPSPLLPSFEEVERTLGTEDDGRMESGRPGGSE